ncbi:acyltransferase [Myroides profundi]|nr:acyltransferase [Myroides profundi]
MVSRIREILWSIVSAYQIFMMNKVYGMYVDSSAKISFKAKLDKSINPKGVFIGKYSMVLYQAVILAHNHVRALKVDTVIENNCIIGIRATIILGVIVYEHSVVASGSVVTKDVPPHCIVAGNPARVIKEGKSVSNKGQIVV